MYRDDLGRAAEIADLKRRIRVLETQAPVGFTSVSRGALRIISPEGLIVDGSAQVGGRLDGSGVFDWTGAMWLRGSVMLPGTLTGVGNLLWSGPWELRGDGDITGDVSLRGKILVGTGAGMVVIDGATGEITAGGMTIDPTGGGKVTFPGGAEVKGYSGGGVRVSSQSYDVTVTASAISIGRDGRSITVRDSWPGFQFVGLPTISETGSGGLPVGSMYVSPIGEPYRVVQD